MEDSTTESSGEDGSTGAGAAGDRGEGIQPAANVAAELADVLEALAADLRQRNRGPLGLPAPPRPRDVLRFTDEYTIPFLVAVLEANVRALELLQGVIRSIEAGDRGVSSARGTHRRARVASRATLERLDGILAELETAVRGDELPQDGPAREVVEEARALRTELEELLAVGPDANGTDRTAARSDRSSGEGTGGPSEPLPADEQVDVESELRAIKADLDGTGAEPEEGRKETGEGGQKTDSTDEEANTVGEKADPTSGGGDTTSEQSAGAKEATDGSNDAR